MGLKEQIIHKEEEEELTKERKKQDGRTYELESNRRGFKRQT